MISNQVNTRIGRSFENINVLNPAQYMIRVYAYMFFGVLITAVLTWKFGSLLIAVLGGIIFLFMPVICKRWVIKQFMSEATFSLSDVDITVVFHQQDRKPEKVIQIPFVDLTSYRVDDCDTTLRLNLYMANGAKQSFQIDRMDQEKHGITDVIVRNIKAYNSDHQDTIGYKRHFITTRSALVLLVGVALFWGCAFIYLITYKPEIWPTSLIAGASLCLQMFHLRKRELKMNEEHA